MPNGTREWVENELPKLEAFFGKISNVLEDFAKTHNLLIDKYYHQGSHWTMRLKHPLGGVGHIEISKLDDDHVWISPFWCLDDYDKYTVFSKEGEKKKCHIEKEPLQDMLDEMLRLVLFWPKEDLRGKPDPTYKRFWHEQWTKEEFEKQDEQYPIPKID